MAIIESILVLVAIYLVIALLATQLSEQYAGMADSRQRNARKAIDEAFGSDPTKADEFLQYAPIYALSKGSKAKPSAIPPDVFASSWLAVLNKMVPPRSAFRYPSEFVQSATALTDRQKQLLAWMVAGVETDWDALELRVAKWYSDICDRAEGWYKRWTAARLFLFSALLTLLLNVDTHFLFKTLMSNDDQRIELADLVETALRSSKDKTRTADALTAPTTNRLADIQSGVDQVQNLIDGALKSDTALRAFGNDTDDVRLQCDVGGLTKATLKASNSDAWSAVTINLNQLVGELRSNVEFPREAVTDKAGKAIKPPEYRRREQAELLTGRVRVEKLMTASGCVSAMRKWVSSAALKSSASESRKAMDGAVAALDRVADQLKAERTAQAISRTLRIRFEQNPDAVRQCIADAASDIGQFIGCLEASDRRSLPLGWPVPLTQFCSVGPSPADGQAADEKAFFCPDLEAQPLLEVPALRSTFKWIHLFAAAVGWTLTAVLVSLGAPFWFGILGKVADLRLAGRVRGLSAEAKESGPSGSATIARAPSPAPAGPSGSSPPGVGATAANGAPVFDDARNAFELTLRPQDISRLQKAVDVPPTQRLDQVTRNAVARRLKELGVAGEEELNAVTFEKLTGRRAPVATVVADKPDSTWVRGVAYHEPLDALVAALNRIFPQSQNWTPLVANGGVFDDEVRARTVLYRALVDVKPWSQKDVVAQSRAQDKPLTVLDALTRQAIVSANATFTPVSPAWMGVALGELGISEDPDPLRSDPRVAEYLSAMDSTTKPKDETAWCGAFVGWVMQKTNLLEGNRGGINRAELLGAERWKAFGKDVAPASAQFGDICIVEREPGKFHVGFWVASGATAGRTWLLGGNQGPDKRGAVTLVLWSAPIAAVRRPAEGA